MRIIGGTAGKRKIYVPARGGVRPTTDRVKEALFQILPDLNGKTFLDLYAGAGSVGLEAISRGVKRGVFVERDRRLADAIRVNLERLGFLSRAEVWGRDAAAALAFFGVRGDRFDVIFADPPYEQGIATSILRKAASVGVLAEAGLFVLQHSRREDLTEDGEGRFDLADRRTYGDTVLSFFTAPERGEGLVL